NGELYRIVVQYDRYEIEGLAVDDIVEAVSLTYGPSAKPSAPAKAARETYGDQEDAVAHWQDTEYYFDLMRSSYGPTFKLIGVYKRLDSPAQAAILEARRLDDQ